MKNQSINNHKDSDSSQQQIDLRVSKNSDYLIQSSYRTSKMRYVALFLSCTLMIGNYLCYDFPAYLNVNLMNDLHLSDEQFNLFYTIYSTPNVFLPLLGGLLVDKIGVRWGIFLFSFVLIVGQAICTIGATLEPSKAFIVMLIGRVVFGLGGENLCVAQSAVVSNWFLGKELSLALGLNVSVSRMGSVIGSYMYPPLYNIDNTLYIPLLFGAVFCAGSWLMGCALCYIDKKADNEEGKNKIQEDEEAEEEEPMKCSDLLNFQLDYWLICISCILCYISIFPFQSNAQNFIFRRYGVPPEKSSPIISITYLMAACTTPFVGHLVDKIGCRTILMICCSIIMTTAHILFLTLPDCPDGSCNYHILIIPFVLMGVFYSFYSAVLWPCVAIVADPKIVGTAFGVILSLQNAGLASGPLIVGYLIHNTTEKGGYWWFSMFFIICGVLSLFVNIALHFYDRSHKKLLSKPSSEIEDDESTSNLIDKGKGSRRSSKSSFNKRSFNRL